MTDDFNEGDKYFSELLLVLFGLFFMVFSIYNIYAVYNFRLLLV